MKTTVLIVGLLMISAIRSPAESTPVQNEDRAVFSVAERGSNHRVWQRTTAETDLLGQLQYHTNSYTELASGLHYQNAQGEWVDSSEEIEILPQGGAAATQGQHQAYFPADIFDGIIELVTPDGKHLKSRPLGIGYFDGTNNILIAELTNSVGQLMPSGNQVIYTNCFTDFAADLRFSYRKSGFEQDIILRQQPPSPNEFGMNPETTHLQVFTEFFDTADPVPTEVRADPNADTGLTDTTLSFGKMKMVRGKAFSLDDTTPLRARGVPVYKSWEHLEGRKFLVEEVPLTGLAEQLNKLPLNASVSPRPSSSRLALRKSSGTWLLPRARLAQVSTVKMQMAKADVRDQSGVVLDYLTLSSSENDMIFLSNHTYYVSGYVYLGGDFCIIQEGAVIKFARGAGLDLFTPLSCPTNAARPAILTAVDDNTVGETNAVSTGNPTGTYAEYAIATETDVATPLQNLRISYADLGMYCWSNVLNCEFHYVNTAIWPADSFSVGNVLLHEVGTGISSGPTIKVAFLTAHHVNTLLPASGTFTITNSLFICVINFGHSFAGVINRTNTSDSGVFQTAGLSGHYLATSSAYRDIGTTTVDAGVLAAIQTMTTYSPQNGGVSDADTPDLGYHYRLGNSDFDGDGLSDGDEVYVYYTHPGDPDTDGDGISDGNEVLIQHTNPSNQDSDADGVIDQAFKVTITRPINNSVIP